MKNVFKVMRLYLKRYLPQILIILMLFSVVAFVKGGLFKEKFKEDYVEYSYSKMKNYGATEFLIPKDSMTYDEKIEFRNNFDKNITKEEFELLKTDVIANRLEEFYRGEINKELSVINPDSIYKSEEKVNIDLKIINPRLYKVINDENFIAKVKLLKEESDKINDEIREKGHSLNSVDLTKVRSLANEINKEFPTYSHGTSMYLSDFVITNLETGDNVTIKENYYSAIHTFMFMILVILIVLLIFGLEYHTTFGKFVAQLPYKKETIYFGKLLASIVIFIGACLLTSLINIWVIKTSVLTELITTYTAFTMQARLFVLALSILLIGAIFASFCGSVVSILSMYVPTLSFVAYPYVLCMAYMHGIFDRYTSAFGESNSFISGLDELLKNGSPIYLPVKFYVHSYYENFEFYKYFGIIFIFLIGASYIYKYHDIEKEGKFFTFKTINIICYILATISFAILPIMFFEVFIGKIFAIIIGYIITAPILYFLFKVKIKI